MSPEKARELRVRIAQAWLKDRDLTAPELATRMGCDPWVVQKVVREMKALIELEREAAR